MNFESRTKRVIRLNNLLAFVREVIIAAVLTKVFEGGVVGFLLAVVGLELLYLAIWAKNSIWSWLAFSLFGRKFLVALLQDNFRALKFPEPDENQNSVKAYFESLAEDESQPIAIRLAAASRLGALNYPIFMGRFQEALRLTLAYEDALIAFKQSFGGAATKS